MKKSTYKSLYIYLSQQEKEYIDSICAKRNYTRQSYVRACAFCIDINNDKARELINTFPDIYPDDYHSRKKAHIDFTYAAYSEITKKATELNIAPWKYLVACALLATEDDYANIENRMKFFDESRDLNIHIDIPVSDYEKLLSYSNKNGLSTDEICRLSLYNFVKSNPESDAGFSKYLESTCECNDNFNVFFELVANKGILTKEEKKTILKIFDDMKLFFMTAKANWEINQSKVKTSNLYFIG